MNCCVCVVILCEGRLLQWHPGATENKRRAIPAYNPDLLARFCKESSLTKREMLPEMDMMDVGARQENLAVKGEPIMLQLCVVPAYALTVHKTQVCRLCFERGLDSYVSPSIFAPFPP